MLKVAKGEIELEGAENTATTAETAKRALAFYTATDTGPSALLAGDEPLLNGVPLRKTSAKTSRTYSTAGWRTLLVYCTRRPASLPHMGLSIVSDSTPTISALLAALCTACPVPRPLLSPSNNS
jgi:hypothetical protein